MKVSPILFLEAWATGVPVISLSANPGDVIDKFNLGVCCNGNLEKMKKCIEADETININRERLIAYVNEFPDFETAAERFLNIIKTNTFPETNYSQQLY
jgi:glycosyltransferase involved in cell wall biosynthesis